MVALDPNDPITVNYVKKVDDDPTGKEHPELLKMQSSPGQGHNNTIINGMEELGIWPGRAELRSLVVPTFPNVIPFPWAGGYLIKVAADKTITFEGAISYPMIKYYRDLKLKKL